MTRPLVSVVMSTYQRGHLLRRAIHGYNLSRFPLDKLEVIVVDDGSTDGTDRECEFFDSRIDVKYVRLRKTPGLWRDCAAVINVGLRAAQGLYVLLTHPEIVPGRESIQACFDLGTTGEYSCCKGYYLKPADMDHLDAVNFDQRGPLACRDIPGFRDKVEGGHPDYHPDAIEKMVHWESWIFGGFSRGTWKNLGGMIETQKWGSVDLLFLQRRKLLGLTNHTALADDALVVHLNHDDPMANVVTPRDINAAHAEAGAYHMTHDNCRHPAVDFLW